MSGSLRDAVVALRTQLSECPAFIARCLLSNVDPSLPLKHISLDEKLVQDEIAYTVEMNDHRPFMVLMVNPHSYQQVSQGVGVGMVGNVSIDVMICDNARETDDPDAPEASMLDFLDFTSSVTDWMAQNSGKGPYLWPWSSITQIDPPIRTKNEDRTEELDFWATVYQFRTGVSD